MVPYYVGGTMQREPDRSVFTDDGESLEVVWNGTRDKAGECLSIADKLRRPLGARS